MDTSFTNSKKDQMAANRCKIDWESLSLAEQIRSVELDGFVILPDLLSTQQVEEIRQEVDRLPTTAVDYSEHQKGCKDVHLTDSPACIDVIAHPPTIEFLSALFGDELLCTSCTFACSEPGHPGVVIHTDSQPYGSKIFGQQASAPILTRVLYYLDDLTPERSPFKVVPRSHLSMHRDANPYRRYLRHPDEMMITCGAGSAAIINQKVFHGNYPNYDSSIRRMLAIAYRPAWAGPVDTVPDHNPNEIAHLPKPVRRFFRSMNAREIEFDLPNRPDDMPVNAEGISPIRWG